MRWPWRKKTIRPQVRLVRARFDAAQTTAENRKHWANADALSPDAAASPEVRRTLRSRARYEVANNSYAKGIVLTLANDCIGTGPRLQMQTEDAELNTRIEGEFAAWAQRVGFAGKLRTMRMARAQDGEAFGIMTTNPALEGIQLDLHLVEADQIATPSLSPLDKYAVDGIRFDSAGNPTEYHMLTEHPGGMPGLKLDYYRLRPESVLHWFRPDRPGQSRGIPELTPALPLFADLRRYTLAVIAAAETAANIPIVMTTTIPPGGEAAAVETGAELELSRNTGIFAPEGWAAEQIKAEQPATMYPDFKREILNEIARCLNMPYNIAAGNSSSYNYASGRLDHQTYFKAIRVEQAHCETAILDRVLAAWLAEAKNVLGLPSLDDVSHQWFWDGFEHVDPSAEAQAQEIRLRTHSTTLAHEYALQGRDWEMELQQRKREVELMKEWGLMPDQAAPGAKQDANTTETQRRSS